jgi:hypothetical protein
MLGSAVFHSAILTDHEGDRDKYFLECSKRFAECNLIFFDPDKGLEVKSTVRGCKGSSNYLYWNEVCDFVSAGPSILIYQHFPRENRREYVARRASELLERTRLPVVFLFRTPHTLFLLGSQEHHVSIFRSAVQRFSWDPKQINPDEHSL